VTERFIAAERTRAVRVGVARDAVWVSPIVGLQLDEDERGVLEALAPHVAHAIARVRLESTRAHLALARERLSHFILHDLKNPLSIIDVNLRALRDEDTLDEEMRGAVADALAASAQTKGMLQDLLDVGLAEEGRLPFRPTMTDAEGIVKSATEPFRSVIEARGARLTLACSEDARLAIAIDAALVTRVLQNLITNASRFVPTGGEVKVEVALSRDRERVVVAIENDGPSIPDAIRTTLFEKYGQANAAQATHNRGLGLYFCRLVTDRHGGDIRVLEPATGSGARFEIALPVDPASARAPESARLEECAAIPSTSTPPQAQRRSGRWRFPTQSLASIDASPTPPAVAAHVPAASGSASRLAPLKESR
jgi:K+-sensing histidine kinase KdpD